MDNKCVCCGADIPEGRQICPKCNNFTVDDRIEQAYRQGYEAGAKQLAEAKKLLENAYEVIKSRSGCAVPCIYCAYDSTKDCSKGVLFKWKYAERAEMLLGGAEYEIHD